MTIEELRNLYFETLDLFRAAEEKQAEFNLELSKMLRARRVPSGYHVDLFGDGAVKKVQECRLTPDGDPDGDQRSTSIRSARDKA